jgi:ribosomal protein S18 acetylase RimI-like enzyme
MELIKCTQQYWEFVRMLRNDERVISGFIKSVHITKEMQINYMTKHSQFYRIATIDNQPCGYVGVIDNDIRICTHPNFQGKGVGKFMLKEIIKIFPTAHGKVKIDNKVSKKLFKSVGFKEKFIIYTYD